MTKLIFTSLIMALTISVLHAQDLQIHKTDGTIYTIPLNVIDSITFVDSAGEFTIIGTWNIDKFSMWWENSTTGELIEGPDSELNGGTVVFNENNTGIWNDKLEDENMSFTITWFIFGDKITIEVEEEFFSAEYTISDKSLNSLKLSYQKLLSGTTLEKREIYLSKLN